MRIVSSQRAAELIQEGGGRLFVWPKRAGCCGGSTMLAAATAPPAGKEFRLVDDRDFELYLPTNLSRRPEELHLDVSRFPRRLAAYWDGCAWM
jgi:hypothetical protein